MSHPPPELNAAITLQRVEASADAHTMILIHLLTQLAKNSPVIRKSLEELLGTIRPMNQAERTAENENELRLIMTYLSVEQILRSVSDQLDEPLVPKGGLRSI